MTTSVKLDNYSTKAMAHPEVSLGVPAFASGSPGSVTKVLKHVNADDYAANYASVAKMGLAVKVDGTYQTGVATHSAAGNIAATTHIAVVTTDGTGFTLTLPAVATVGVGFRMWIHLVVDGGGNLTVDGNGSETVDGAATKVLSNAGDLLAIISTATGWDLQ